MGTKIHLQTSRSTALSILGGDAACGSFPDPEYVTEDIRLVRCGRCLVTHEFVDAVDKMNEIDPEDVFDQMS